MTTVKQTKASLARIQLSNELNKIADEIREVDDDIADSYLSRELALYRRLLANRATVLSMANSLQRCRLHAEKLTVNGLTFKFGNLNSQADFLQWTVSTPFSILNNRQKRLVADIVNGYDEVDEKSEKRLQTRLARQRELTNARKHDTHLRRISAPEKQKLLTNGAGHLSEFSGETDLPY